MPATPSAPLSPIPPPRAALRHGGGGEGTGPSSTDPRESDGAALGGGRIRCPRCGFRPRREDRWSCTCLHVWNTFETRGRCPSCGRQWLETQCLACGRFSPHEEWYEKPAPP